MSDFKQTETNNEGEQPLYSTQTAEQVATEEVSTPPAVESDEREKRKVSRRILVAAGATAVVLGAGITILVGANHHNDDAKNNAPQPDDRQTSDTKTTSTPETSPSPVTSEAASNPNVFERTPLPTNLEKYRDMSVEQFQTLDKGTQWLYVSWLIQYEKKFEDRYYAVSGLNEDQPVALTPTSSADNISTEINYGLRMAAGAVDGTPKVDKKTGYCGPLDLDSAEKIVSAYFGNVYSGAKSARDSKIDEIKSLPQAVCVDTQALKGFFLNSDTQVVSSKREQAEDPTGKTDTATFITLNDTKESNGPYQIEVFIQPFKNYDGTITNRPYITSSHFLN